MNVIREGAAPSELDKLAAQADQLGQDDQEDGAAPGAEKSASMTNAQILGAAFELVRETVCTVAGVKSPRASLSSDKLQPLADAWGAVCDKHGVSLSEMVGDYMIELKAVALTIPVLLGARNALQAEMAQRAAAAAAAAGDVTDVTEKPAPGVGADQDPSHGG